MNNYTNLKTSIASYMGRTDLEPQIPDFIRMAEASMNRTLRVRQMVCTALATVSGTELYLPGDYLGMRTLQLSSGDPLIRVSPEILQSRKQENCSGDPRWYLELGRKLEVFPAANDHEFEVVYYRKIPPLSVDTPSNWLLDEHPDAYLTGAMSQYALLYVRDDERSPQWDAIHQRIIGEIVAADKADRWSGNVGQVRVA